MAEDLVKNWNCKSDKVHIINNPIAISSITKYTENSKCPTDMVRDGRPLYISAGRLTHQKGYDIILKRMYELKNKIPFKYYILGEGEEQNKIENLINKYNLSDSVALLGFKPNVYDYIYHSDGLILSSRYEGFPNIVLEANALGIPVFSNSCQGGINEIIIDGENGLVCDFEDKDIFHKTLNCFQKHKFETKKIIDLTRKRYDIKIIMNKYAEYFNNLLKG